MTVPRPVILCLYNDAETLDTFGITNARISLSDLKKAYFKESLRCHPDKENMPVPPGARKRYANVDERKRAFQRLNDAYTEINNDLAKFRKCPQHPLRKPKAVKPVVNTPAQKAKPRTSITIHLRFVMTPEALKLSKKPGVIGTDVRVLETQRLRHIQDHMDTFTADLTELGAAPTWFGRVYDELNALKQDVLVPVLPGGHNDYSYKELTFNMAKIWAKKVMMSVTMTLEIKLSSLEYIFQEVLPRPPPKDTRRRPTPPPDSTSTQAPPPPRSVPRTRARAGSRPSPAAPTGFSSEPPPPKSPTSRRSRQAPTPPVSKPQHPRNGTEESSVPSVSRKPWANTGSRSAQSPPSFSSLRSTQASSNGTKGSSLPSVSRRPWANTGSRSAPSTPSFTSLRSTQAPRPAPPRPQPPASGASPPPASRNTQSPRQSAGVNTSGTAPSPATPQPRESSGTDHSRRGTNAPTSAPPVRKRGNSPPKWIPGGLPRRPTRAQMKHAHSPLPPRSTVRLDTSSRPRFMLGGDTAAPQ